jgi:hypothetical protein
MYAYVCLYLRHELAADSNKEAGKNRRKREATAKGGKGCDFVGISRTTLHIDVERLIFIILQ